MCERVTTLWGIKKQTKHTRSMLDQRKARRREKGRREGGENVDTCFSRHSTVLLFGLVQRDVGCAQQAVEVSLCFALKGSLVRMEGGGG